MMPAAASPDFAPVPGRLRRIVFSPPGIALLVLLIGLVAWSGLRLYIRHRDRGLMFSALRAIDTGDFRSARVWLQRLYLGHPDDISVTRLIARYDATQRLPQELAWRERVVQIGPATLGDYLDWAGAALRLGQNDAALAALNRVPPALQSQASYHELCGVALAAAGQPQAAGTHFATALSLEPANPVYQVHLSALQLAHGDTATRNAARSALEGMASSSTPPLAALRALLDDALRQRDPPRIARYRAAVRQRPDRTLDDELACISAAPSPGEAHTDLAALWQKIANDPIQALQVAEWMLRRGDNAEALGWLRKLPAGEQANIGIQTGEADALTALHDWAGLRTHLTGKNWQDCDFLRIALLVRCARETNGVTPAWSDAVAACEHNGPDMLLLARTALSWSWRPEAEALYWRIAALDYASRGPALEALWDLYGAAGNTPCLLVVSQAQYKDCPTDPAIRNNFAFLSLLSGIGIGSSEAGRIAKENFLSQPENPNLAATYAFALYLEGHSQEGLRVLDHFGAQRMQEAGAALYLALLQKAAGQEDAAAQTAAAVDPRKLLPEERVLLQKINPKPLGALQPVRSGGV